MALFSPEHVWRVYAVTIAFATLAAIGWIVVRADTARRAAEDRR
jgi:hypothetical protein